MLAYASSLTSPNHHNVSTRLRERFANFPIIFEWNVQANDDLRSSAGYVGLVNQGATCYMNSIMQQFFMTPAFRRGIIECKGAVLENPEDNLLYQMVYLFCYLQCSIKRAYGTKPFCETYKDYDGNKMNVFVQMDVDEFFNMFFDKLENLLKETNSVRFILF